MEKAWQLESLGQQGLKEQQEQLGQQGLKEQQEQLGQQEQQVAQAPFILFFIQQIKQSQPQPIAEQSTSYYVELEGNVVPIQEVIMVVLEVGGI